MGNRQFNGNFSFLPMPLISIVKDQSKLPESLLIGGQRLDTYSNVLSETI